MQESGTAGELDLSLINALQLAPRAPWSELAPILDVDATTLARHWRRLEADGLARITLFPRAQTMAQHNMAYVELTCRNGTVEQVASQLSAGSATLSIQFTAGSHQLLLTVAPRRGLADYLLNWIGTFPDILSYRVHTVTHLFSEADQWQVRALSAEQRRRLCALAPPAPEEASGTRLTGLDRRIVELLCVDGRASYGKIAQQLGIAPTTAARRLNRLLRGGIVGLRCDIARSVLGWPTGAVLWGSMAPQELARTRELGKRIPELRLCSGIAGPENTHFIVWLRSVADLTRVERRLQEELPGLVISDRRMVLRVFKLMGAVMDPDEHYTDAVPLRLGVPAA
ncbi:Lrp/AsnC family transcriptional regulator [Nocardiopsis coralliicola]